MAISRLNFKRQIFHSAVNDYQRHGPKTNASIPKYLACKMQQRRAAAGMEAAFPLPAAKFDRASL